VDVPDPVVTVVEAEFRGSDVHGVDRLSGGCKDTYRVTLDDQTVVVAFPREPWYERAFALEPALMRLVRAETSLPVPPVLASDVSGEQVRPYHVTAFVDAPNLQGRFAACTRETQAALLEAAGAALAELHRGVRFASNGPLRVVDGAVVVDPQASWPAFLSRLVEEWLTELDGGRFADLREAFERVLTPASFLEVKAEPVCLHFDYAPGNLLARGEAVVGVVDWGFAVAGHAEYDLFQFEKNFLLGELDDPAIRDALRPHVYAGYHSESAFDPGWERRRAFYRVAYKLASMRSLHRWSPRDNRDALARQLRTELESDIDHLRTFE
jgi:Ser/Thr protein kinase RdoA (MazF antagonist)